MCTWKLVIKIIMFLVHFKHKHELLFKLQVVDTISSVKFTGGSHYDVVLFDEFITINLEFMTKFGQYCDEAQMSKIRLTEKENTTVDGVESSITEENKPEPYIVDIDNIEDEDTMLPEELNSKKMLVDQFGHTIFGQVSPKPMIYKNHKLIKNV